MATTIVKTTDLVWYFFGRIEKKYKRGDRQNRKTKSGYWKKTGPTADIKRESGNREKMGENRFLTFYFEGGLKSKWVMHEYHATFLSPNQMMMMTYTLCKIEFNGDISCYVLEITESPDLVALDWVMCHILNPDFVGLVNDDEDNEGRLMIIHYGLRSESIKWVK